MATDNEQVFRIWMQKQTQKNKDKGYTNNTIEAYCGALATKAKNLQLPNSIHIQPNLFLYNDFQEFQSICDIIRTAPNYKEIDKKAGNGAFSAGIQRYLEFLHDKNRASIQEDNKTMGNNELKKYTELLRMKKNIILQGAPGTGKTYTTAALALSLIDENISYFNHDVVMEKYQEYVEKGQIAFVTFHQSMDYEDFVEGLKPQLVENSDGNTAGIAYRVEDGIFKRLCKQAKKNYEDSQKTKEQLQKEKNIENTQIYLKESELFETIYASIVHDIKNKRIIEYSVAGGDPIPLKWDEERNRIVYREKYPRPEKESNIQLLFEYFISNGTHQKEILKYNQDKWFNLINIVTGGKTKTIDYIEYGWILSELLKRFEEGGYSMVEEHTSVPEVNTVSEIPYILIIDEINRGNVSKIFGELITLLESDKRTGSMHPINVRLPYSKELFSVPPNIYLIGTMNTTDRSVGTIDYAVRRRFAFITLKSEKSAIEKFYDNVPGGTDAALKNKALELFSSVKRFIGENKIEENFDDLMPGHSYFMAKSDTELEQKFTYEVLPLLYEYHKDGLLKTFFDETKINNRTDDDQ